MMPIGVFAFRGMRTRSWMQFWMSAARRSSMQELRIYAHLSRFGLSRPQLRKAPNSPAVHASDDMQ
jgi:hypothetical protein